MVQKTHPKYGSFEVVDEGEGIVSAGVSSGLVRMPLAEEMCTEMERAIAAYPGKAKVLMDMEALSKATPAAGLYAMRRMKELGLFRIALVGGNDFMRAFGRVVMTLARFRSFAFFSDHETARKWLARPG